MFTALLGYRTWLIRYYFFWLKKGVILIIDAGLTLKSVREKSGVSLEEVSNDLNISIINLEQIESGSIGSFDNIYELKRMILEYSKYLGVNDEDILKEFNEYMFEYTSKIPMDEIEREMKKTEKENDVDEGICSPYTKVYPKEKTKPYIIAGIVIFILVILAVIWSIKQIRDNSGSTDLIGISLIGE